MELGVIVVYILYLPFLYCFNTDINVIENRDISKIFDGIGAISGGGATSKLLVNYPDKQRNEILDYLFKPKYGASLQILKVEIGGDSQSTDGSESSHMHTKDDENYHRGYEWWIMREAKKRNPSIKLYGLPWVFPGWLGDDKKLTPYSNISATVRYVINWIKGAKSHHGLDINYIGVWNERDCDSEYVKLLRRTLNIERLTDVMLVAPDAMDWSFIEQLVADEDLMRAVDIIGQHYPGGISPEQARTMKKKLWSSEDFSTFNDVVGAGCWAKVLNEGVVYGYLTSFIAWNLVCSYYEGLPYTRNSLMTANQPWSGHYDVEGTIWITAHHTHFYDIGWMYLPHGSGVGVLVGNGTYITVTDPSSHDITIVMETIDPQSSPCTYPMYHNQSVADTQQATFQLMDKFTSIKRLHMWQSHLNFEHQNESFYMKNMQDVQVNDGKFTITIIKNSVITLTTVAKKPDMKYPEDVPVPQKFPVPYIEDFEAYLSGTEPHNLAQQSGSFEVTLSRDLSHHMVLTQLTLSPPIDTCLIKYVRPFVLVGDYMWKNVRSRVSVYMSRDEDQQVDVRPLNPRHQMTTHSHGVFIASQMDRGGCDAVISDGVHFYIDLLSHQAYLSNNHNMSKLLNSTYLHRDLYNRWFTIQLDVTDEHIIAMLDDDVIFNHPHPNVTSTHGFVAFGPMNFGMISFDDFVIGRAQY